VLWRHYSDTIPGVLRMAIKYRLVQNLAGESKLVRIPRVEAL
jgi:hypothetical protein